MFPVFSNFVQKMEKRKIRIFSHFEDILEEKKTLEENLDKVINHVYSCVDRLKNFSDEVKLKDCSLILSHELEIFKKLTEFNYELENVIEKSPLGPLKLTEKKYEAVTQVSEPSENVILPNNSEITDTNFNTSEHVDSSIDSVYNNAACASSYISELIAGNCNADTNINFSDNEIQRELRDTLKKFSNKFGIDDKSLSCMKDYYEKPSVSCVNEPIDKPSSSHNLPEYLHTYPNITHESIPNFEAGTGNEFDLPEKDTNNATSESIVNDPTASIELPSKPINLDTTTIPIENKKDSNLTCTSEPVSQNNVYCPDISSLSSDTEIFNCKSENSSNENFTNNDNSHCQVTNSDLIHNIIKNDESDKTEDNNKGSKKIIYTALEKLNNTKFLDRKEEALNKTQALIQSPNLKLRPSESQVIKNDFEVKNKLKKKKNKKGKSDVKDKCFYDLRCKPVPKVGMECAFSHVENPSEFYIHIVDEESTIIDMLTEKINDLFYDSTSTYTSKEEASSSLGTYCFAFLSAYNGWYRAKILDWYLENKSENVLIQLVDFGNKRSVTYKNLRKMTKEMAEHPMLAVRCHLPLMYPPHSTYFNRLTEWPCETIDALADLSGLFQPNNEENKFFKVVYAQEERGSLAIDLYNSRDADPENTVGQILLDLGLAVQIIEEPDRENMELEEFLQDIDTLERADNINEAIIGYDPRDEARICRFTKPDGTCFKGKNCKLEHVPLSRDGFTTDKEPVFKEAMDTLLLPAMGKVIMLLITGCKDACNFFAQIVRIPHKEKNRSLEYVIDNELYSLLGTMNNPKVTKTFEPFKVPPAIGEVVIAKHKLSKKWLRAIVRERVLWNDDESEEYQVFMVDFGDYMQLPLSDLRKINPHFLQLPFQAIECYIHNYKAKNDCNKRDVEEFFFKNLLFHNFVAVVMSASLPLKVEIKTFNGFDISKVLMEKGFAEERIYDTNPIDDCPLQLY